MQLTENDCWFLIQATSHTNPDPMKDQRGCYKCGDLIGCYPGITDMGTVGNHNVFMVGVTGMTFAEGRALITPDVEVIDEHLNITKILQRRRYFASENIKSENLAEFAECVTTGRPYIASREDFVFLSLSDKVD
jgi:hypothetical protein